MSGQQVCRLLLFFSIGCLASCGEARLGPKINKVPVVAVEGTVTIDGKPEAGVIVRCLPLGAIEPSNLANAMGGRTDDEGKYTLGTYEIADGVPPGEFALVFTWPVVTIKKQSRADEEKADRLKGKYAKKEKPALKITVKPGEPLVLDELKLTTK